MATTRLGQLGVGVQPYPGFAPKDAAAAGPHNPGVITRLAQFGVVAAKYGTFAPKRYFGDGGDAPPPVVTTTVDGSGIRFLRGRRVERQRLPEDYERERQMLEEYLESLEQKAKPAPKRLPARLAKKQAKAAPQPVVPRLTEAMAQVAAANELKRIETAERAAAEDKEQAKREHERRRRRATAAVLLLTH